jgi:hypothetical protein
MLSRPPDAFPRTDAQILDAYEVVAPIAIGEHTVVHRARRKGAVGTGSDIAIKRFASPVRADREARSLLLAAGRAGRDLDTPNVIKVLDVHEAPEVLVVMPYVEGVNLAALRATLHPSDMVRYTVPLLVDALQGLQALHERRDASGKPAALVHGAPCARHILAGTDGVGRIVDLTHAVGPGIPWSARRAARLDPAQMAPEQALFPESIDRRCDLFIVGTVLWESLTGMPLFRSAARESTLESLLEKTIPAPSDVGSCAASTFDSLCLRALQRSRTQRFGSAAEMAESLRAMAVQTGNYATRSEIAACVQQLVLLTEMSTRKSTEGLRASVLGLPALSPAFGPAQPSQYLLLPPTGQARSPERRPKRAGSAGDALLQMQTGSTTLDYAPVASKGTCDLRSERALASSDRELVDSDQLRVPTADGVAADALQYGAPTPGSEPRAWRRIRDVSAMPPGNRRMLASALTLIVACTAASAGTCLLTRESDTSPVAEERHPYPSITEARADPRPQQDGRSTSIDESGVGADQRDVPATENAAIAHRRPTSSAPQVPVAPRDAAVALAPLCRTEGPAKREEGLPATKQQGSGTTLDLRPRAGAATRAQPGAITGLPANPY